ncbi:hypothetical protein D3C72_2480960 [compost metagenome]
MGNDYLGRQNGDQRQLGLCLQPAHQPCQHPVWVVVGHKNIPDVVGCFFVRTALAELLLANWKLTEDVRPYVLLPIMT